MLDEIRSFFDELRNCPAPPWPGRLEVLDPAVVQAARDEYEEHWKLTIETGDNLEANILKMYDDGTEEPAAIDLIDEVVAIIRRKGKPHDERVREIGRLMRERSVPMSRG